MLDQRRSRIARLSIALLGSFQVTLDGEPVTAFESDKVRALLAFLAVEAGQAHRRDALIGLLWPERPERAAHANLRTAIRDRGAIQDRGATRDRAGTGDRNANHVRAVDEVSGADKVRETGPPFLIVTRQAVQFNAAGDYWLDVEAFAERAASLPKRTGHGHKVSDADLSALERAAALYRGPFLEGLAIADGPAFEEWALFVREQLDRQALAAFCLLAAGYEARGKVDRVVHYARRQVALEPWREEAHRQWMRALAASGQRGAALAQYAACCRILRAELGAEPEAETTALYERIRVGVEAPAGASTPTHDLPIPLIPLIGREAELSEIVQRLGDPACRLLTLVGPGGIGKTHLALEAAARQAGDWPHGVYLVPLSAVPSVEGVVPAVARALGVSLHDKAAPRWQLLDYLRHKEMLVILDGVEHLLAEHLADGSPSASWGVESLAVEILQTAQGVKVLATSRARLNVPGEHLYPVGGLEGQYSAVQLFLAAARRVRPAFEGSAEDMRHVARICQVAQGLPLAILLAAGWMRVLSPAEIAAELSGVSPDSSAGIEARAPGRGIDFLQAGGHAGPGHPLLDGRHRSLRAVFDASWNLLSAHKCGVMQALSVFRGGCTRQAAQHVSGISLAELAALADQSLLQCTPGGRYEMHELLRQYAAEKLAASPEGGQAARDAHCGYFVDALRRWGAGSRGPRQKAALEAVEVEIGNVRAAWDWALERGQVEHLDRAMDGLCRFYQQRERSREGESLCRAAAGRLAGLETLPSSLVLRTQARALAWQSYFHWRLGRTASGERLAQQSLALLEGTEPIPAGEGNGDPVLDGQDARSVPSGGNGLGDRDVRAEVAFALLQLGRNVQVSDRERAGQLYERSLAVYRALGDRWGTARLLNTLGELACQLGEYGQAGQWCAESLAAYRALGDRVGIADALWVLGASALFRGQIERGERLVQESCAIRHEIGDLSSVARALIDLGTAFLFLGQYDEACARLEQSAAMCRDLGSRRHLVFASLGLGTAHMHRGQYDPACVHLQAALDMCREMGFEREIGHALCLLGRVALAGTEGHPVHAQGQAGSEGVRGTYVEVCRRLQQSVAISQGIGQQAYLICSLTWLGHVLHRLGRPAEARQHFCRALRRGIQAQAGQLLVDTLAPIAFLFADRGEVERAVELYALASRHPHVAHSRWFEDLFGRHIAAAAAALPPDAVAAAQERGRAGDLYATAAELLSELGG